MATCSTTLLARFLLLATFMAVAQALTQAECSSKEAVDSNRCIRASLTFCERWVCQQNANRKFRICMATVNTDDYILMKDACDTQQRADPAAEGCEFPPGSGTTVFIGNWHNKGWCNRTENPQGYNIINSTVHAQSDALDLIITNRTAQAINLINQGKASCDGGVPSGDFAGLPECICAAVVSASCVELVRTEVIATDPARFPTPDYASTVASNLVNDFNFTQEEADTAAATLACVRYPALCQASSPAPARRLLHPYVIQG